MMLIIKESSKQEEKRELPLTQNHKFTHIPYFVFNSLKEWEQKPSSHKFYSILLQGLPP